MKTSQYGVIMKTSTEIEIVWEIWHLISRLNDLIWDLYENEFMHILEKNGYTKSDLSDVDFPF
jgi:cupin superfamily acireductone dioxygenase involved in methionine salvage